MSLFKDVRFACPEEIHSALQIYAQATGKELGEVLRDILRAWFTARQHEYDTLRKMLGGSR
jgi:plasmid stability protein